MSLIAEGDILEVKIYVNFPGRIQIGINVRYFKAQTQIGLPTTNQAAINLATDYSAAYLPCLPAAAFFWGVGVRNLGVPNDAFVYDSTGQGAGSITSDPLPLQTAGIITLRTALAGRANRGRVFVAFPPETGNSSTGIPSGTYLTALGVLATQFGSVTGCNDGAGNSCALVPVIKHANGTVEDITATLARTKWGRQGRRGDYGRMNVPPF